MLSDFIPYILDFFRIMATIYLIIVIIYIYNDNYIILICIERSDFCVRYSG